MYQNFHTDEKARRKMKNFYIDHDYRMKLNYWHDNYAEGTKALSMIIKKFCKGRGLDIGGWDKGNKKYLDNALIVDKDKLGTGNAEDLSLYIKDSFDFILHSHTLEHLLDPEKAIEECYRVLKPGGVLILYLPYPGHDYHDPLISPIRDRVHKWQPDPISIQRLLVLNDFNIIYMDHHKDEHLSFLTIGLKI